jgi:hypothetical protein
MFKNVIIKKLNFLCCCIKPIKYNKINNEYNEIDDKINIIIEANKKFYKNVELL